MLLGSLFYAFSRGHHVIPTRRLMSFLNLACTVLNIQVSSDQPKAPTLDIRSTNPTPTFYQPQTYLLPILHLPTN